MVTPCDSGFLTRNIISRQTETFQTSQPNFTEWQQGWIDCKSRGKKMSTRINTLVDRLDHTCHNLKYLFVWGKDN